MRANVVIALSIFVAMVLSVLPLPQSLVWARPEFTLLVLCYWTLALPEKSGIFVAAMVGLFQDGLTASVLGQHLISYSVVIAAIVLVYQQLRVQDVWKQAVVIFILLVVEQLIESWISLLSGVSRLGYWIVFPSLIGALIWPWLMISLRGIRRKAGAMNKLA